MSEITILHGDCRAVLRTLPADSFHACVTSPPYFGLRDYGVDGQMGMENTPAAFVAALVEVFREVRRVLRPDGTLWLNLGDSYAGSGRGGNPEAGTKQGTNRGPQSVGVLYGRDGDDREAEKTRIKSLNASVMSSGLKPKDLIGIPWRVAFALQEDGWWLRQWLPWVKRNAMPKSTRDRPSSACETWFMLTRSERYFYDYAAVRKVRAHSSVDRHARSVENEGGTTRLSGGRYQPPGQPPHSKADKQSGHSRRHTGFNERWDALSKDEQTDARAFRNSDLFYESLAAPHGAIFGDGDLLALDVPVSGFKGAHYATFPPAIIEPLILTSCPPGGHVLGPFGGAGTTGLVADRLQRHATLIDLNPANVAMARERIGADAPLFGGSR